MDSGDKVEMAVALDELLEAREQAIKRAAFEDGALTEQQAIIAILEEAGWCSAAGMARALPLVSPPAQETG
jgi:hypothetical protein